MISKISLSLIFYLLILVYYIVLTIYNLPLALKGAFMAIADWFSRVGRHPLLL